LSKKRSANLLCVTGDDETRKEAVAIFMNKRCQYFAEKLSEFKKNSMWVSDEREKLRKKYPNTYIAVRKRRIIASDKSVSPLVTKVRKLKNNEDIVIDFIGEQKIKLLL